MEDRTEQLSNLETFITKSKKQLDSILDALGWSREDLLKEEPQMVFCPLNPQHRMPQSSLKSHLEKCSLHHDGYRSDEEFLSASEFASSPSVVIDHNIMQQLFAGQSSTDQHRNLGPGSPLGVPPMLRGPPRTSARLLTDFTPAERSALHDFVISTTGSSTSSNLTLEDLHLPLNENSKQSRAKSKLELLAEQRDAKRRRMNHKKVHTSRKTHTEVLREVIQNQMEYLSSQNSEKTDP